MSDSQEDRIVDLERENALLREELREYWLSYHVEHCWAEWPHRSDDPLGCGYPPPEILGVSQ